MSRPERSFANEVRYLAALLCGGFDPNLVRAQLVKDFGPNNAFLLYQAAWLYIQWTIEPTTHQSEIKKYDYRRSPKG